MRILDIGGGFPGFDGETGVAFWEIAAVVRAGVGEMFGKDVRVIAEPGRFFATQAYTLGVQVLLAGTEDGRRRYWLGDGVFGAFRDAWLLDVDYPCELLVRKGEGEVEVCDLCGPSRDGVDVISRGVVLERLEVGDWLRFGNMGAYTRSLNTGRSGVRKFPTVYFAHSKGGAEMDGLQRFFQEGGSALLAEQAPFPI